MGLKDILVHLDGSDRSGVRLDVACRIAAQHGAHVTGLHVIELPTLEMFSGLPMGADIVQAREIIATMRDKAEDAASPLRDAFEDRLRRDGLPGEWRLAEGAVAAMVAMHGRYADLVVIGQADGSDPVLGPADLPVASLMSVGRPLLIVPYAGRFASVGAHVLIGWNGSREATRAVADALPLLAQAQRVTVLSINPRRGIAGDGDVPAADMALHLSRHGIRAEAAHTVASDIAEGDALLSYAADIGADLLVTGMYGHTRLREMVFGGATRSLLATMTVPVLMSH